MNIFSKAAQNLPLTPAQRAFLKLLKGWLYTALSAGIIAGAQLLLGDGQIDYQKLAFCVGGAFLLSILSALDKYWSAQGDLPLALVAQAGEKQVQQAVQQAQSQKAPQPILFPTPPLNQLAQTSTQQRPQFQIVQNPQEIPAINLASSTAQQNTGTIRHFGDSQIIPVVQSQSKQ